MGSPRKNKKRSHYDTSSRQTVKDRNFDFDADYFVWPNPILMILITFGIVLLVIATFQPASIPGFLGPIGSFAYYMGTEHNNICVYLCVFCAVAHSAEAALAGKVCHDRGMTTSATIKWTFSTFCFGFASFVLRLLPHKPRYKIV